MFRRLLLRVEFRLKRETIVSLYPKSVLSLRRSGSA